MTSGAAVGRPSPMIAALALSWAITVGGVGEDLAAGAVVAVIVAEDQVLDRPVESLGDLGFKPGGRLFVDGIGDDHAIRRHQEDGIVKIVLEAVEIARDAGDGAFGLCVKRAGRQQGGGEEHGGDNPRYGWFHEVLLALWRRGGNRPRPGAGRSNQAYYPVLGGVKHTFVNCGVGMSSRPSSRRNSSILKPQLRRLSHHHVAQTGRLKVTGVEGDGDRTDFIFFSMGEMAEAVEAEAG